MSKERLPAPAISSPEPILAMAQPAQESSNDSSLDDQRDTLHNQQDVHDPAATPFLDAAECEFGHDVPLDQLFDLVAESYRQQLTLRRDAIDAFSSSAAGEDPPPLAQQLAYTLGAIALDAATAGIASSVTSRLASGETKLIEGAVKKSIDSTLKRAALGGLALPPTGPEASLEAFSQNQREALTQGGHAAVDAFIANRHHIGEGPDAAIRMRELACALQSVETDAGSLQANETLREWCRYQARAELGTDNEGEDNEGTDLSGTLGGARPWWLGGDLANGVLDLEIRGGQPKDPIEVVRARVDGLPPALLTKLEQMTIGEMGLPISVHGYVQSPGWLLDVLDTDWDHVAFGKNEGGTVWCRANEGGLGYLHERAGHSVPEQSVLEGGDLDHLLDARYDGAREIVDEILEPNRLDAFGVTLEG